MQDFEFGGGGGGELKSLALMRRACSEIDSEAFWRYL